MQGTFDFGAARDLAWIETRLAAAIGPLGEPIRQSPMGQLVRSLIGSRTRDEVSQGAYADLRRAWPSWRQLAAQETAAIRDVIADVRFADAKAVQLKRTVGLIGWAQPDFDLAFLGTRPVPAALAWLRRLPGVGLKVAAATLNFSTLRRPAFVADSHVLRVFQRLRLIGPNAGTEAAYKLVMGARPAWDDEQLADLHAYVKLLGQTLCRKRVTACDRCPLGADCPAARPGLTPRRER